MKEFENLITTNNKYLEMLRLMASLSRLSSDSTIPFLYYRVTENLFCRCLNAQNLSRDDTAYDAKLDNVGIGIKTFIFNGKKKTEKVAEFNALADELNRVAGLDLAEKLSDYRNDRIEIANRLYGIDTSFYHIIGRDENCLKIFNTSYDRIVKDSLRIIKDNDKVTQFTDGKNQYSFYRSKSVLMKEFKMIDKPLKIEVEILDNPFEVLEKLLNQERYIDKEKPMNERVILPLYSNLRGQKCVPLKSGLNQWNAGGRARNEDEVYFPVPAIVHKQKPNFFPSKNESFKLILPDGKELTAKICQDGDKALMSNPNKALGHWILRKVLKIKPGKIVTYQDLEIAGFDSVSVTKLKEGVYKIDVLKSDRNF